MFPLSIIYEGEGGDKGQKGEKGDQVSIHTLSSFVMHPQQFVRSLKGLTTAGYCLKVLSPKKGKYKSCILINTMDSQSKRSVQLSL